jgi:hypothetical protein
MVEAMKLPRVIGLLALSALATTGTATAGSKQVRAVVYEPQPSDSIRVIYVDGQPVAVLTNPELPVIVKVSFERLRSKRYMKAWVYVLNRTQETIELMPQQQLSVDVLTDDRKNFYSLQSQTPSTLAKTVEDAKNIERTAALFGGIVRSLSASISSNDTRATTESPFGTSTTSIHDRAEKAQAELQLVRLQTDMRLGVIESIHENMKASISSTLLRRNTLNPGISANGNMWFEFDFDPRKNPNFTHAFWKAYYQPNRRKDPTYAKAWEPELWMYRVTLRIPGHSPVSAVFAPTAGE